MYSFRCIPYCVLWTMKWLGKFCNDYLIMIWDVKWPALYFDLGFLCRSFIIQVYYAYMFMFMWVIYGRLQLDIWTVDHRCDRITYNPLWMWTGYPDLFLIRSVYDHRRYGRALPIYLGLTTQNGDTCLRVNHIAPFVLFGLGYTFFRVSITVITSIWSLSSIFFSLLY